MRFHSAAQHPPQSTSLDAHGKPSLKHHALRGPASPRLSLRRARKRSAKCRTYRYCHPSVSSRGLGLSPTHSQATFPLLRPWGMASSTEPGCF